MFRVIRYAAILLLAAGAASAQNQTQLGKATVVATCGTPPSAYTAGQIRDLTQNTQGELCSDIAAPPAVTVSGAGDGVTDDTDEVQAAFDEWLASGVEGEDTWLHLGDIVISDPHLISDDILVTGPAGDNLRGGRILFVDDGELIADTAGRRVIVSSYAGVPKQAWRGLQIEGFRSYGVGLKMLNPDQTFTWPLYQFTIDRLNIQSSGIAANIAQHGLELDHTFESSINFPTIEWGSRTKSAISIRGQSSIHLLHPQLRGGLHALEVLDYDTDFVVTGGTFLHSDSSCVYAEILEGTLYSPHVENCARLTNDSGVEIVGGGTVINPVGTAVAATPSGQKYAVEFFEGAAGSSTIIGGQNDSDVSGAKVAFINGAADSFVHLFGVPSYDVHASMVSWVKDVSNQTTISRGTWTPVITFGTPGNLSVAYSIQRGDYVRVGTATRQLITATASIVTSSFTHTTASGGLLITGLPCAVENIAAETVWDGPIEWRGITKANYTDYVVRASNNSANLVLLASASTLASSSVTAADMPTGGTVNFKFTVTYPATAC